MGTQILHDSLVGDGYGINPLLQTLQQSRSSIDLIVDSTAQFDGIGTQTANLIILYSLWLQILLAFSAVKLVPID